MESQRQLKEACGEAPWYVLHCPSCAGKIADRHNLDSQYPWAIHLTCDTCHSSWWACRYCPTQRSRLTTTGHLSRHRNGKYHLEMVGGREGLQDKTTTTAPLEGQTRNLPRNKNREDNKVVLNPKHFPRTCCTHFFEKTDMRTGLLYLARKAILQSDNATDNLDPEDVETFLETAFYVSQITRSQRQAFATLLARVCYTVSKESERRALLDPTQDDQEMPRKKPKVATTKEDVLSVNVLTTKEEMRSRFISGKYALFQNLPHPEVHTLEEHAFVLPTECLADFMAHGLADSTIRQSRQSLKHQALPFCSKARKLVEKNNESGCRTIFGSIWSDGFDPNTKLNNRGSAWVMTLTLETEATGTVSIRNVYPLVVGKESDDHRKVMELIWEDLASLKSSPGKELLMYNGKLRKEEKVSLHILAVLQDQPERREHACL